MAAPSAPGMTAAVAAAAAHALFPDQQVVYADTDSVMVAAKLPSAPAESKRTKELEYATDDISSILREFEVHSCQCGGIKCMRDEGLHSVPYECSVLRNAMVQLEKNKVVTTIPKFSKQTTCVLCRKTMVDCKVWRANDCGDEFHANCLFYFLLSNRRHDCPHCRVQLRDNVPIRD